MFGQKRWKYPTLTDKCVQQKIRKINWEKLQVVELCNPTFRPSKLSDNGTRKDRGIGYICRKTPPGVQSRPKRDACQPCLTRCETSEEVSKTRIERLPFKNVEFLLHWRNYFDNCRISLKESTIVANGFIGEPSGPAVLLCISPPQQRWMLLMLLNRIRSRLNMLKKNNLNSDFWSTRKIADKDGEFSGRNSEHLVTSRPLPFVHTQTIGGGVRTWHAGPGLKYKCPSITIVDKFSLCTTVTEFISRHLLNIDFTSSVKSRRKYLKTFNAEFKHIREYL